MFMAQMVQVVHSDSKPTTTAISLEQFAKFFSLSAAPTRPKNR